MCGLAFVNHRAVRGFHVRTIYPSVEIVNRVTREVIHNRKTPRKARAMPEDFCPKRGAGLRHVFDDGIVCEDCGITKRGITPDIAQWWRSILGGKPVVAPPTSMVASGEPPVDSDFASLTPLEWHRLQVERRYHESHACDDR